MVGMVMPVMHTGLIDGLQYFGQIYSVYLFGEAPQPGKHPGIKPILGSIAMRQGVILGPLLEIDTESPVKAQVRSGRWLAQCPECMIEFQYVWLDNPLYMCSSCWNAEVGGIYRTVELPTEIEEITRLLLRRPDPSTRDWLPSQVIEDLETENIQNGVS